MPTTPPPPVESLTVPPEAVRALVNGDRPGAIKLVREAHKVDLKTATTVVESYIEVHPELKSLSTGRKASRQGWMVWVLVAVLIAWLIYRWL
jgi:hypothetical protein